MSSYEIKGWNVVMFNNSTTKVPMIYVKPDLAFKEFAESNSYAVMCEISDTGTIYDGKKIPGIVDKSCYVPNCRPNFCEATGYYVITLWANWYGYPEPDSLGKVKFFGLKKTKNPDDKNPSKKVNKTNNAKKYNNLSVGLKKRNILIIAGILSVILLCVVAFSIKKAKSK